MKVMIEDKYIKYLKVLEKLIDNEVIGYDEADDVLVINKAVHLEVLPNVDADPVALYQADDGVHTNTVICVNE